MPQRDLTKGRGLLSPKRKRCGKVLPRGRPTGRTARPTHVRQTVAAKVPRRTAPRGAPLRRSRWKNRRRLEPATAAAKPRASHTRRQVRTRDRLAGGDRRDSLRHPPQPGRAGRDRAAASDDASAVSSSVRAGPALGSHILCVLRDLRGARALSVLAMLAVNNLCCRSAGDCAYWQPVMAWSADGGDEELMLPFVQRRAATFTPGRGRSLRAGSAPGGCRSRLLR